MILETLGVFGRLIWAIWLIASACVQVMFSEIGHAIRSRR